MFGAILTDRPEHDVVYQTIARLHSINYPMQNYYGAADYTIPIFNDFSRLSYRSATHL